MSALPDRRFQLIRLVHVAKRDLAMPDEAYRDLLKRETKKTSCSAMTEPELDKVLKALRKNGFRVKHSRPAPQPTTRKAHRLRVGQAALITALWIDLWQLGAVRDNSDKAIDSFVDRQVGIAHMQWLSPNKANQVIEALKAWCEREGFTVPQPEPGEEPGLSAKRALCVAIYQKLRMLGAPVAEFEENIHYVHTLSAVEAQRFADDMGFVLRAFTEGQA